MFNFRSRAFTFTGAILAAGTMLIGGSSPAYCDILYISGYGTGTLFTLDTSSGNQTTLQTGLGNPEGLAFDGLKNLYLISGTLNFNNPNSQTILEFAADGTTKTIATGTYGRGSLAFDQIGNLYVTTLTSILKITPSGTTTTFATGLNEPRGLVFDSSGNLYVTIFSGGTVVKIAPNGSVSTFASSSLFSTPEGLAFDKSGNLFVSDANAHAIFEISSAGNLSTFYAGSCQTIVFLLEDLPSTQMEICSRLLALKCLSLIRMATLFSDWIAFPFAPSATHLY